MSPANSCSSLMHKGIWWIMMIRTQHSTCAICVCILCSRTRYVSACLCALRERPLCRNEMILNRHCRPSSKLQIEIMSTAQGRTLRSQSELVESSNATRHRCRYNKRNERSPRHRCLWFSLYFSDSITLLSYWFSSNTKRASVALTLRWDTKWVVPKCQMRNSLNSNSGRLHFCTHRIYERRRTCSTHLRNYFNFWAIHRERERRTRFEFQFQSSTSASTVCLLRHRQCQLLFPFASNVKTWI